MALNAAANLPSTEEQPRRDYPNWKGPASPWTDEREAMLRDLWDVRGFSANDAALEINRQTGSSFTRNAILGKVDRLNLSMRNRSHHNKPISLEERRKRKREREAMFRLRRKVTLGWVPPTRDEDIPLENRKQLMELENNHCRWPVGEPGKPGFFFCGAPTANLIECRPYCASHQFMAWKPRAVA